MSSHGINFGCEPQPLKSLNDCSHLYDFPSLETARNANELIHRMSLMQKNVVYFSRFWTVHGYPLLWKKKCKSHMTPEKKFQDLLATTGINLMNPSLATGKVNKLTLWLPRSFALHGSGGSLASGVSTRKLRLCLLAQQFSSKGKEEIKWH